MIQKDQAKSINQTIRLISLLIQLIIMNQLIDSLLIIQLIY